MRKKLKIGFVSLLSIVTLVAYQNCSNSVQFGQADLALASSSGEIVPTSDVPPENAGVPAPVCRPMTAAEVKPHLFYSWDHSGDSSPEYKQVMAAPVVGDLDGDRIPEIVFVSYLDSSYTSQGVLRVLNGATGASKFSIESDALRPFASTTPLLIDIDGNGKAEIFYVHYSKNKIVALNHDGSLRWELAVSGVQGPFGNCMDGFAAADLDRDGLAEIIAGHYVITENAQKQPSVKMELQGKEATCRTYAATLGESRFNSEFSLIGTEGVFDAQGAYQWKFLRAGSAAVADLQSAVEGIEVVVTGNGYLTIYNGRTGAVLADKKLSEHSDLICRYDAAGNGIVGGGQATIGDFDGNPETLEIAVATGKSLTIFDNRGEKIAGSVTEDCSSLTTGLTSFDFNGDGKPEIIYADEEYVRIYEMNGSSDLNVVWKEINPSGTLREYPVVADVNGDGYAELVVVANNMWVGTEHLYSTEEEKVAAKDITGLRVFRPASQASWMPTRPIWNQYAYMATNVRDNLTVTTTTLSEGQLGTSFKRNIQKENVEILCSK